MKPTHVFSNTDPTPKAAVLGSCFTLILVHTHVYAYVCIYTHIYPYMHIHTKARRENWVSRGTLVQRQPESPQWSTEKATPLDCTGSVSASWSTYYWCICTPCACYQHCWDCTSSLQVGSVDKTYFQRYLIFTSQSRECFFSPYISLVDLEKPSSVLSVVFNLPQANTSIINSISFVFLHVSLWHFFFSGVNATWHYQCAWCFLAFYLW